MTDLWLAEADQWKYPLRPGMTMNSGKVKVCLHMTQGSSIAGAMSAYAMYPPHLITDLEERHSVQHIPLNKSSYSLKNSAAEREPVIQVEIVGFSEEADERTKEELDFLVHSVLIPIYVLMPFELTMPSVGFGGQEGYGVNGKYRMKMDEWVAFSGIVGHCHSPSPDTHWDPGDLDVVYILKEMYKVIERPEMLEGQVSLADAFAIVDETYRMAWGIPGDPEGMKFWVKVVMDNGYDGWCSLVDGLHDIKA